MEQDEPKGNQKISDEQKKNREERKTWN